MQQPLFWGFLAMCVLLGAAARFANGGPLLAGRAATIERARLGVAGVTSLALAVHCGTMFFAPWTDAVPGGQALGRAIRELGPASQWTYWLPAAALLLSLLRVWWPGLVLLGVTLSGVGITMFWPYPLSTHLSWLAAAVLTWTLVAIGLIRRGRSDRPPHLDTRAWVG
jgi:hypothetical protein